MYEVLNFLLAIFLMLATIAGVTAAIALFLKFAPNISDKTDDDIKESRPQ